MKRFALVLAAGLVLAPPALALDPQDFRFERSLTPGRSAPRSAGIFFEPDVPIYSHAQPDFRDLRVLDRSGREVPWRLAPRAEPPPAPVSIPVLNSGRQGGKAVALLDFGVARRARNRIELDVPDANFVAKVEVLGSDDRRTYTRLSTSVIYDIQGAETHARSTIVVYPVSDFRYLLLRARGISRIDGATVARKGRGGLRTLQSIGRQGSLIGPLVVRLGSKNVPVTELTVSAANPRYDRAVRVDGSNDGKSWAPVARARMFRLGPPLSTPIPVGPGYRLLRVTIENGDDEPLVGVGVTAWGKSRALLVEGSHPGPFKLLYGNPAASRPSYEFARLPLPKPVLVAQGFLGPEQASAGFEPPPDTRSFAARHSGVVTAALALAAMAVAFGGFLALRRRT